MSGAIDKHINQAVQEHAIWCTISDLFRVEHGKSRHNWPMGSGEKAIELDSGLSGVETVKDCLKYGLIKVTMKLL